MKVNETGCFSAICVYPKAGFVQMVGKRILSDFGHEPNKVILAACPRIELNGVRA